MGWRGTLAPQFAGSEHRRRHAGQIMGGGDNGDLLAVGVLVHHALEEAFDRRAASDCRPCRFTKQLPHRTRAIAGDVPQAVFVPGGILARHQPKVSAHAFEIEEAFGIVSLAPTRSRPDRITHLRLKKRLASSMYATSVSAVRGPTPGIVLSSAT